MSHRSSGMKKSGGKAKTVEPSAGSKEMLPGLEEFSRVLQGRCVERTCVLFKDETNTFDDGRDRMFQNLVKLRENDVFSDVTLLVGPNETPMKAHRIILSACYDYFGTMFTSGLKESLEQEVRLPCVDPDSMKLILEYAYNGKANITTCNIHKMMCIAHYFSSDALVLQCSKFIRQFVNVENCLQWLEFALKFNFAQLAADMKLFISHNFEQIQDSNLEFWQLPMDVLLDIIEHPATVISDDPQTNETQLYHLMYVKISNLPKDQQTKYIVKLLEAVHLPQMKNQFLNDLKKKTGHIRKAKELIKKAKKAVDPTETRQWYLPRYKYSAELCINRRDTPLVVDSITTNYYSKCVLINGLPWFVYEDKRYSSRSNSSDSSESSSSSSDSSDSENDDSNRNGRRRIWSPGVTNNLPCRVMAKVTSCQGKVLYEGDAVGGSYGDEKDTGWWQSWIRPVSSTFVLKITLADKK